MTIDLYYLLKVSLCSAGFYLLYYTFLRGTVYFRANRFYLLVSLGLSFLIPVLTFNSLEWSNEANLLIFPEIWTEYDAFSDVSPQIQKANENTYSFSFLLSCIYWVGVGGMFLRFFLSIGKSCQLILQAKVKKKKGYCLVISDRVSSPCSFFNFIIIPVEQLDKGQYDLIIAHECGHIRQGHTYDVLLVEIAAAFLWFNPFILLYKKSLRLLHEYLADGHALRHIQITDYLNELLHATLRQNKNGLVSHFNHSTIKKRIQMITIQKHSKIKVFSYFLAAPLLAMMLFAFAKPEFRASEPPSISPIEKSKLKYVSSSFGMRTHPITKVKKFHKGVDFAAPTGTPVLSTAYGKVLKASYDESHGNFIVIVHDEHFQTRYNHLDGIDIQEGDVVRKGQQIGTVGNTGISTKAHLHYEVWKDNEAVDPDPYF